MFPQGFLFATVGLFEQFWHNSPAFVAHTERKYMHNQIWYSKNQIQDGYKIITIKYTLSAAMMKQIGGTM